MMTTRRLAAMALCLMLAGCSSGPQSIPVYDRTLPPEVTWGAHVVSPGETLFSIAWLYGRDFRELAKANNIDGSYTIYPGQKLTLKKPVQHVTNNRYKSHSRGSTPKKAVVKKEGSKKHTAAGAAGTVRKQSSTYKESAKPVWGWPAQGAVKGRFSTKGKVNKGIDIQGKHGDPVKASSRGQVVYAGSGLTGYGNLIIIKHNASYLSAYAHNHKLLVSEGEVVKAGQKIAEIGSTGTNEPKLHFEIRRNGKPVNPLAYLPSR
ncbi:peptidoglycan DD-metalloendopeptidase family protein [Endozoicomonadaceae bacterium StTr2]